MYARTFTNWNLSSIKSHVLVFDIENKYQMPEPERLPICGGLGLREQGASCFKQRTGVSVNTGSAREGKLSLACPKILPSANRGNRHPSRGIF